MSSFAKAPISGEGDRFEVDVELLVGDDLVSVAALVVGVDVGGGTTGCLTRRVVDVSVDGGVRDADVQNRFIIDNTCDTIALCSLLGTIQYTS